MELCQIDREAQNDRINPVYACTEMAKGIPTNPSTRAFFASPRNMKYPYTRQLMGYRVSRNEPHVMGDRRFKK
jgi:hypothetical protein